MKKNYFAKQGELALDSWPGDDSQPFTPDPGKEPQIAPRWRSVGRFALKIIGAAAAGLVIQAFMLATLVTTSTFSEWAGHRLYVAATHGDNSIETTTPSIFSGRAGSFASGLIPPGLLELLEPPQAALSPEKTVEINQKRMAISFAMALLFSLTGLSATLWHSKRPRRESSARD